MSSAWGRAWGRAWGNAWGPLTAQISVTPIESPINYTFGPQMRAKTKRRREEELLILFRRGVSCGQY